MTGALLLAGALLMLLAAIGVVRLPDAYSRLSAAAKAATLGVAQLLLGAAWHFGGAEPLGQVLVTVAFLYLTTPIAAHRIASAAWRSGLRPWRGTLIDELGPPMKTSATRTDDPMGRVQAGGDPAELKRHRAPSEGPGGGGARGAPLVPLE